MWDQQAVDKWYQENLARGIKASKLDAIVQRQQADYLVQQGVPAKELQTTPVGLRAQTQEVTKKGYKPEADQEKSGELEELKSLATSIKSLAQSGQNVSGPMTGRFANIMSQIGLGQSVTGEWEKRVNQMRSLASQLAAHRSFEEGGKAFTETEKALLAGQVPRLGVRRDRPGLFGLIPGLEMTGAEGQVLDPESTIIDKMDEMLKLVKRAEGRMGVKPKKKAEDQDPLGLGL